MGFVLLYVYLIVFPYVLYNEFFFPIVSFEHCVFLIMLYMLKPKQGPELKFISSYKLSVRNISCILCIGAIVSVK